MSNLGKIITPIEGFQYSVNIAYDIYDDTMDFLFVKQMKWRMVFIPRQ